ncbi:MAG: methyltransferase domain-containing protein [Dehalococcoidales bacterium]|nr:methyltransferase domain-containing protein [Dehalococcoidales bacterium]MDP6576547.1 methyltransferase domain-containing protein [Dehalococcoidales bacterium]
MEALARQWRQGRLLNIGCAHGPDFLPFRSGFALYGVDFSGEMLKFARKYVGKFHFEVDLAVAEAGWLPYPDGTFDWALSVATYHHIKGEEERLKALQELRRVLRSGGEAFITVWNRRQPRFWFRGKEIAVPWRAKDRTLYRDYYLFSYGELEKLAKQAGLKILKSFPENAYRFPLKYFSRNICLLVQKGD